MSRSPPYTNYKHLPRVHRALLRRCIGWRKQNRIDSVLSYPDTLARAECEETSAVTVKKRRLPFAAFVARGINTFAKRCFLASRPTEKWDRTYVGKSGRDALGRTRRRLRHQARRLDNRYHEIEWQGSVETGLEAFMKG